MAFCIFKVSKPFVRPDLNTYVVPGEVVEGELVMGMQVSIPIDGSTEMTARIDAIEFLRRHDSEEVALCFKYADQTELALWESIDLGDEDLIATYE